MTKALPESAWQPYTTLRRDGSAEPIPAEERKWAEVPNFVPDCKRNRKKRGTPFRYIAIRVRSRQRDLQELIEGETGNWRYFAVVSNMDWQGQRLLRWHREKQGSVEHAHGVMKNDLLAARCLRNVSAQMQPGGD